MAWGISEARKGLRYCLLGLASITSITSSLAHAEEYSPPSASIVVDGNSGVVLQASSPDALRHPASLTKIMTLYLLFERLETGTMKLDSQLKVSEHASEQAPTKLGLKPGETIAVEDAIKAIVTKSANDVAVVVAENLSGDEDHFAKLMTRKARTLGMTRTTYVNASGLPDDDQVTTARDQALLGRLIQRRFPQYYKYFSTESFVYRGEVMRNHDNLLGSIEGVDGIKTGFTRASGFNLVTSVHRDGHYIVAVVMGGHSSFERDAHMRELIDFNIKEDALKRTTPVVATSNQPNNHPVLANVATASIQLLSVRTIIQTTTVQSGSLAPMRALGPVAPTEPQPSAQVVARWLPSAPINNAPMGSHSDPTGPNQQLLVKSIKIQTRPIEAASAEPMPIGQTPVPALPSVLEAAEAKSERIEPAKLATASVELPRVESESAPAKSQIADLAPYAPPGAHSGWLIQIGAFDREDEAREHLSTARLKMRNALAAADSSTERVQIGDKVLYRARFTGFDKETAAAACQQLRRSDMSCFVLRN
jgi:D-alanyl-D-alanine carboxypeptidase